MFRKATLTWMVAAAIAAVPVVAQENTAPPHEMAKARPAGGMGSMMGMCQRMMGMMGGQGMMGMMGSSPAMLLRQKDALGLSEDQVQKLEALQEQARARSEDHMAQAKRLSQEMARVRSQTQPDLKELEKLLEEQARLHVEMQMAQARMGQEALAVLTAEQRSNLDYARRLMRSMMQHQMMNGMKGMQKPGEGGEDGSGAHRHGGVR